MSQMSQMSQRVAHREWGGAEEERAAIVALRPETPAAQF
jgi:hypothetical protein